VTTLDSKLVEAILKDTVSALNTGAWRPPGGGATASAFEKEAQRQLQVSAAAYGVENKIILHSGRKFPDIVFENSKFGVEIKTAQKGWSCLGNSVAASTLVDGIDQVYLIFCSGVNNFQVRYGRYEDAVSSVEVTHSPRYMLDMDTPLGGSYLYRIGKTLSEMLALDDPISCVVDEARRNLKKGERIWWISEGVSAPLRIRLWKAVKSQEKKTLIASAFALFPSQILRAPRADYSSFALWLIQRHSILHSNVRDDFSSGGRLASLEFGDGMLRDVPQVFLALRSHLSEIFRVIREDLSAEDWSHNYQCDLEESDTPDKRLGMWRLIVEPLLVSHSGKDDYAISCIKAFLEEKHSKD
jgi:hypothetical protein